MAVELNRGQIWLLDRPRPDKRRPVLIISRPTLVDVLNTVTVVAITSTFRGAPTEVELGLAEGLKHPSCANLCNLFTVPKAALKTFVGTVSPPQLERVCLALAVAVGCD